MNRTGSSRMWQCIGGHRLQIATSLGSRSLITTMTATLTCLSAVQQRCGEMNGNEHCSTIGNREVRCFERRRFRPVQVATPRRHGLNNDRAVDLVSMRPAAPPEILFRILVRVGLCGLPWQSTRTNGFGLGVAVLDFDHDGWMDLVTHSDCRAQLSRCGATITARSFEQV